MLTLTLAVLAIQVWLVSVVAFCIIVAGASRGLEKPPGDGGKRFGRGHRS